jgi:hypothetical protein
MTARRALQAAIALGLLALGLFAFDGLLLKFERDQARLVPAALAAMLGLALWQRSLASRVDPSGRTRLERLWASLDATGLAWLSFLLLLLVVFHGAFDRAGGDGREYFAQLRSMAIDRDLDLANEARDFGARYADGFPFGSAILWLPFYLAAHVWIGLLNAVAGAGLPHDGYDRPYQMAVGLGTLAYGFAGLVLAYRIACDFFSRWLSLTSALAVAAGSFIVWYLTVEASYTHGTSLFAVTAFLYLWHRTRAARSTAGWGLIGLAGGVMLMVRWQNAVFLAPLAADVGAAWWRALRAGDRNALAAIATGTAAAAAGGLIGFLPQMYFWKVVHGGWFAVPHFQAGQQWWDDSRMAEVLFLSNHGLFAWHPVLYLAVLGTPLLLRRDWRLGGVLALVFIAQVYINGAVATWWGGSAFGGRRFDGCALYFVLGLAALAEWALRHPAVVAAAVVAPFLGANGILMRDAATGRLPTGEGIAADRLMGLHRIGNPFSFPANAVFAWRHGVSPAFYDAIGLRLFNGFTIDMGEEDDDRFLLGGWSGRERGRFGSYRWGVGRRSEIAIALGGPRLVPVGEPRQFGDYEFRFRASPYNFAGDAPQVLGIDINGRRLAERALEPGFHDYAFDVGPGFLERGVNVVTLNYSQARSPEEVGRSADSRPLAVRFDHIRLSRKERS